MTDSEQRNVESQAARKMERAVGMRAPLPGNNLEVEIFSHLPSPKGTEYREIGSVKERCGAISLGVIVRFSSRSSSRCRA